MKETKFVIKLIRNERLLREDGRLSISPDERFVLEFDSLKEAADYLLETDTVPDKYKWGYFEIAKVRIES
jgi:hypothetical protein